MHIFCSTNAVYGRPTLLPQMSSLASKNVSHSCSEPESDHDILFEMDGPFLAVSSQSDLGPMIVEWARNSMVGSATNYTPRRHGSTARDSARLSRPFPIPKKRSKSTRHSEPARRKHRPPSGPPKSHVVDIYDRPGPSRAAAVLASEQAELKKEASLGSMVAAWAERCSTMGDWN